MVAVGMIRVSVVWWLWVGRLLVLLLWREWRLLWLGLQRGMSERGRRLWGMMYRICILS